MYSIEFTLAAKSVSLHHSPDCVRFHVGTYKCKTARVHNGDNIKERKEVRRKIFHSQRCMFRATLCKNIRRKHTPLKCDSTSRERTMVLSHSGTHARNDETRVRACDIETPVLASAGAKITRIVTQRWIYILSARTTLDRILELRGKLWIRSTNASLRPPSSHAMRRHIGCLINCALVNHSCYVY